MFIKKILCTIFWNLILKLIRKYHEAMQSEVKKRWL